MKANDEQTGGTHYGLTEWQHWDWVAENCGPGYLVGYATKYIIRWKRKGGAEDLKKAGHTLRKLRELHAAGLPFPEVRLPKNVMKLKETYQLTDAEFSFCCVCATYVNDGELALALDVLQDICSTKP